MSDSNWNQLVDTINSALPRCQKIQDMEEELVWLDQRLKKLEKQPVNEVPQQSPVLPQDFHKKLWEKIHDYVRACGFDPRKGDQKLLSMRAAEINALIMTELRPPLNPPSCLWKFDLAAQMFTTSCGYKLAKNTVPDGITHCRCCGMRIK